MIIEKTENGIYKMLDLSELPKRKYGDSETIDWKKFSRHKILFSYGDVSGEFDARLLYTTKNYRRVLRVDFQGENHMISFDRMREFGRFFKEIILSELPECLLHFPEITGLMVTPKLARYLTKGTKKKIELQCPHCDTKNFKITNNLFSQGFRCSVCETNSTYNEQLMETYLIENKIEYISQYRPNNFSRIFDFYLPHYKTFIEVHGLQHYQEVLGMGENAFLRSQESDKEKREFVSEYGFRLMEINCSSGRPLEIIKRINLEVKSFGLPKCKEEIVTKIHLLAKREHKAIVNEYQRGGSLQEISEKYNVRKGFISQLLQKYRVTARESGTQVVLLNYKVLFKNVVEAGRFANCSDSRIHLCLRGKANWGGTCPKTKERLGWMFYRGYIEQYGEEELTEYESSATLVSAPLEFFTKSHNEIIKEYKAAASIGDLSKKYDTPYAIVLKLLGQHNLYRVKDHRIKEVVCINQKIVFSSPQEAATHFNIKNLSGVYDAAREEKKSAGKHPITGEPLKWMYYEDYKENYGIDGLARYTEEEIHNEIDDLKVSS